MEENQGLEIRFLEFINKHQLIRKGQRVLLAVSGGMDSMAMVGLFRYASIPFALAHCNFSLRKGDADRDQKLVEKMAKELNRPIFTIRFDTRQYALQNKCSVQMAARELRYQWLGEVRKKEGFDLIATAHHLDDAMETLLINLGRGTGIGGLKGIRVKNQTIIRPLMFATREDIQDYTRFRQLEYREDLSNQDEKYLRNKIRHQVIPPLREAFPGISQTLFQFFDHMEGTHAVYRFAIEQQKKHCMKARGSEYHISTAKLLKLPEPGMFLYEFLKDFGFNASVCGDILQGLDKQVGKLFDSNTHTVLRDRSALIVFPKKDQPATAPRPVDENTTLIDTGTDIFRFGSHPVGKGEKPEWPEDENTALMDMALLRFPLLLRHWKPGDRIRPLGGKGSKKISDLLSDKKVPLHKKRNIMVLESDGEIVWVAGIRTNETVKITPVTRLVFFAKKTGRSSGKQ